MRISPACVWISVIPLLACSDGPPLTACEQSVYPECDLHEPTCRRDLADHLACVRGAEPPRWLPKFEFLTPTKFEQRYPPSASLSSEFTSCLSLLALWPEQPTEALSSAPPAFYDYERKAVVVVDADDDRAIIQALAIAQRDTELGGLDGWLSSGELTLDEVAARRALLSGDGTFFGDLAWFKTEPMSDAELREHARANIYYGDQSLDFHLVARASDLDYRFAIALFGAYGAQFVRDTYLDGELAAILEAFDRPIRSTAALVRGDTTAPEPVDLPPPLPLPSGYTYRWSDRMGALVWHIVHQRADLLFESAATGEHRARLDEIVALWRDDRLDCAIDEDGNAFVIWHIAVDPAIETFEMSLDNLPGYSSFRREDDDQLLRLMAASAPGVVF